MKKTIYISGSASIVILLVMFYFHSVSSNTSNNLPVDGNQNFNQDFIQNGNNQSSFSPQSGGWQLQVMPSMGNRLVRDLYFTDSLTGYAVASPDAGTDSAHILKTTNGGNNWLIKSTCSGRLPRIIFINSNTGFAGGNYLLKTTNAGENWMVWNWPLDRIIFDMQVFSEDTIWYADRFSVGGGAFRTTNGGVNWEKRDSGIPANSYPDRIYFYNSRIGYAYHIGNPFGHKTTNAGENWIQTDSGFIDIHFLDSINGFRSWNSKGIQRTTNGGINWNNLNMPNASGISTNKQILEFNIINNDTIYAVGGYTQRPDFSYRAIIYKTTNMGLNWIYLYPDTGFAIIRLTSLFTINNNVWAYSQYNNKGIYSEIGGGATNVNNISLETPNEYELTQNYPNPFNASTNIIYKILKSSDVRIEIIDILGRNMQALVDKKHTPGTYRVSFNGENLGSGILFYQMIVDNKIVQTKRMTLLK